MYQQIRHCSRPRRCAVGAFDPAPATSPLHRVSGSPAPGSHPPSAGGGWSRPPRHVSPESPIIPAVHLPRLPRDLCARLRPLVRVLFPVTVRRQVPPRLDLCLKQQQVRRLPFVETRGRVQQVRRLLFVDYRYRFLELVVVPCSCPPYPRKPDLVRSGHNLGAGYMAFLDQHQTKKMIVFLARFLARKKGRRTSCKNTSSSTWVS